MLAAVLLLVAVAVAAAPLKPPSKFLQRPHHMLVAARVVGMTDGTLRLEQVERLQGRDTAPATLELRAPGWLSAAIAPGQRVVAGYTAYTMDQRSPETVIVNESGPALLVGAGLEPALFSDTPAARAALLDASGSAQARARAVAGLASADPQWQNFFALEVALRPKWHAQLDRNQRRAVEALVRNPAAHPSARAALLRAAATAGDAFGTGWWRDAALDVLAHAPTTRPARADDTTADLVRAAFQALETAQVEIARDVLARWVSGEHAALAELALLAARRSTPDQEALLARDALARTLLAVDTRIFLEDHLRRLDLMRAAERAEARNR